MLGPGRRAGRGAGRGGPHAAACEAAAQQQVEVAQNRLAADDKDPGVHDGVEGVEAERRQVALVVSQRPDGVDEAGDLRTKRRP